MLRSEGSLGARTAAAERARALTPGEIAWIATIPAAFVALLAIVVLGPPLGRALLPPDPYGYWPSIARAFRAEPAEHGRYLVSLVAPVLLAAAIVLGAHRQPRMRPAASTALVAVAQLLGAAFVVACIVVQRRLVYGPEYWAAPPRSDGRAYFTLATYGVAALLVAAILLVLRSEPARTRLAGWAQDTRPRRLATTGVAAVATSVWLLHAFNTEDSIGNAASPVIYHMQFTLDETFAVLNGRSPLVDFAAQYGSLWNYPIAAFLSLAGPTIGTFSGATLTIAGVSMLAIFAVLRRVARSPLAGLLLFLPFLASSFFLLSGTLDNRYTFGTLTGTFPMRYAGPFLLAWLLVRHIDGAWPRQPWIVLLAAGLVVLNNADAGIPAFGATIAALLWTSRPPRREALARLGVALLAGTAAALVLVSAFTLLRAGELPRLDLLLRYPRMFGAAGFGMLPMPTIGLHVVIYLTFVATIGVATVRALSPDADRGLTGMLIYSGVFGLGAGAYFVGRSHPESLIATFTTWTFALALLTVVTSSALAARPRRTPSAAALACLFAFGVAACSVAQTPLPWQQIERIGSTAAPALQHPDVVRFVRERARTGERVLILNPLGHRVAEQAGVVNVGPYTGIQSMPLRRQLDEALTLLRDVGGTKVFAWAGDAREELAGALQRRGFVPMDAEASAGLMMWLHAAGR